MRGFESHPFDNPSDSKLQFAVFDKLKFVFRYRRMLKGLHPCHGRDAGATPAAPEISGRSLGSRTRDVFSILVAEFLGGWSAS